MVVIAAHRTPPTLRAPQTISEGLGLRGVAELLYGRGEAQAVPEPYVVVRHAARAPLLPLLVSRSEGSLTYDAEDPGRLVRVVAQ